jgi:indole-3-glycerol phosphate synthase
MILKQILEKKYWEIEALRNRPEGKAPPASRPQKRDFAKALRHNDGLAIIAEIKRHSPSKGLIREKLDPGQLAMEYERAGAASISVLTDNKFFGGSMEDLRQARLATALPVLRKDFMIDESQIWQSAGPEGPDAILLIVAALAEAKLAALLNEADLYGLACLVETHTEAEVETALRAGAEIIGINNRDLHTFEVDVKTTERLSKLIPPDKIIVSESGLRTRRELRRLEEIGVAAALIGETLLQSPEPGLKLRELLGENSH